MADLCEFNCRIHYDASGLLLDAKRSEYNPYFGVHATFGEYKQIMRVGLNECGSIPRHQHTHHATKVKDGEYTYGDVIKKYSSPNNFSFRVPYNGDNTRIDEMISFELFCHTRNSGMDDMNQRESKDVERQITCGIFQLEVVNIINAYKQLSNGAKTFNMTQKIFDDKVIQIKMDEYAKRDGVQMSEEMYKKYLDAAIDETHKGLVTLEITMKNFSDKHYNNSVYAMKNFKNSSINSTCVSNKYTLNAKNDANKSDGFIPISYTSQMGIQRMMSSLETHVLTPYCHHFMKMNNSERDPLYLPSNNMVANLQLPMWIAKQGRLPVAVYWSCHDPTTREYHNEDLRKKDLEIYGYTEKTEKFFTKLLTASLRRHGLSADLFEKTVRNHFSNENKSTKLDETFLICEEVIADVGTFAANTIYYTSDYRFVSSKHKTARLVPLDSWDNSPLNNIARSDDCEGQDNVATTVIRAFATGRHTLGFQWESSLLNSVKLYLNHSIIYDVGATVTSAYVDTNNKKIETKQKDLPMIGDPMDINSQCDGHCHALMGSLTDGIRRMETGNLPPDLLNKIRGATIQCDAFQQRDAQRKMLVLEPTGSIEPRILPVKEAYALSTVLCNKKEAERHFMKSLRTNLEKHKDLMDMFVGEGMQHYVEKQDPNRRISSFYNEVVHATSVDLWKRFDDPTLSQFAFTRKFGVDDWRYGSKIADFIRTSENYALVFPFTSNRQEWQQNVIPLIESVEHQLPIMSFGRYGEEDFKKVSTVNYESRQLSAVSQEKFEKLIYNVAQNPNQSVVRLYSRPWKLKDPQSKTQLDTFLSNTNGMIMHGYYTEHQIPVCDPIIEILCVIDVQKCLALSTV
jgi:hypothetical protein